MRVANQDNGGVGSGAGPFSLGSGSSRVYFKFVIYSGLLWLVVVFNI